MHGKNVKKFMCKVEAVSYLEVEEKLMFKHF